MRGRAGAVVLIAMALAAAGCDDALPEPRVVRLNDRVHVLMGPIQHANRVNQGYMINSTVIVGNTGLIVVDSGGTLEVGRHIARAARRIADKPVTHVINTHHHGDHYLGNAAFPGATIISSEMCRRMVLETGGEWLKMMEEAVEHPLPGTVPIAATLTLAAQTKSERVIDGVRILFWVPRGSHTSGDLLVHLPDDDVLIAGDVLVNGIMPTLQDGFVKNWIETLDAIDSAAATRFVPGHGDLMNRGQVAAMRDAMRRFYVNVREAYLRGESEAEMRKSIDVSMWQGLDRAYVIGRNINRAYLEVEAENF